MTPFFVVTRSFLSEQPDVSRKGRDFGNGTSEKEPRNFRDTNNFNPTSVPDELDDGSDTEMTNVEEFEIIEPDISDEVDVLDKNVWKPRLIFENKTETTTASSVIMRIGPKNLDLELFNIEAAPFQKGRLRI